MKNQYVGDIGDYGKYGLLRFIAKHDIQIGVNWYLTEDDGSSDGKFTSYLEKPENRVCDPKLYDALKELASINYKTVEMIEDWEIIPQADFFGETLKTNSQASEAGKWDRSLWFNNSKLILEDAELIFADPDNGISFTKTVRTKGSEKYILPKEVCEYYHSGKNVVFYCHKGRRKQEDWEQTKTEIRKYLFLFEKTVSVPKTNENPLLCSRRSPCVRASCCSNAADMCHFFHQRRLQAPKDSRSHFRAPDQLLFCLQGDRLLRNRYRPAFRVFRTYRPGEIPCLPDRYHP